MRVNRVVFNCCFAMLSVSNIALTGLAKANENVAFEPFFVTNNLPISTGLGLPKTLSAQALKPGEKRLTINLNVKSNANDAGAGSRETLIIDGETHSLDLGLSYGLSERWQLDAQLSYLRHSSGSLDSLIQNWHDFFGLDDGDRPAFGRDEFLFSYTENGEQTALDQAVDGISDLRLGLGYRITQPWVDNLMLRFGLSLPTGNAERLTGSDDVDADIGIYASGQGKQRWKNLGWHANLGYVLIGDESALGIETRSGSWFNSLGGYWALNSAWTIKGQLDSHGALFESDISEINQSATELTLGLAYRSKRKHIFEIYFSEDITVNRAADFSFGVSARLNLSKSSS